MDSGLVGGTLGALHRLLARWHDLLAQQRLILAHHLLKSN
jgi:hypothetical protein